MVYWFPVLMCILFCILGMSFVMPMLSTTQVYTRLFNIGLAFIPPYLLLSTSYPCAQPLNHSLHFVVVKCIVFSFYIVYELSFIGSVSRDYPFHLTLDTWYE